MISRTHPDLIRRLFELEVPEIYDGIVEIRSIAREPGVRSKVAVSSIDERLDPVGACVGPKGSRVRTVVSELRGERVDVVLWSDDPARCVANALSPAKVSRVIVDSENNYATVIVPDDQLSLAIGKEGQNARLAARLTGLHIDIKNETLAASILKGMPQSDAAESLVDEEEGGTAASTSAPPASGAATWHAPARTTAASTRSSWIADWCPTTPTRWSSANHGSHNPRRALGRLDTWQRPALVTSPRNMA